VASAPLPPRPRLSQPAAAASCLSAALPASSSMEPMSTQLRGGPSSGSSGQAAGQPLHTGRRPPANSRQLPARRWS
jgi:hypothetical protein